MQVTTQQVRLDSLALVTGVGGPLETVSAALVNAPFTPTKDMAYADFSGKLATFTGSTPKVITWGSVAMAANGQPFQESQLLQWICTATPGSPEDIYGVIYYLPGTPNVILGADVFTAPVRIAANLDSVQTIAMAP